MRALRKSERRWLVIESVKGGGQGGRKRRENGTFVGDEKQCRVEVKTKPNARKIKCVEDEEGRSENKRRRRRY